MRALRFLGGWFLVLNIAPCAEPPAVAKAPLSVDPVAAPAPLGVAEPLKLCLPTENRNLLDGRPEKFFMYVDRTFDGVTSKPWQGGTYGLVRTPVKVAGQVVLRQFHEGIDIAPARRDPKGNPLDPVSSIAAGTVAYVSAVAGHSNYGKYVVVEHCWEGSPVYSLYAHLAEVGCQPGDRVAAGGVLGKMGYTGVGLNRTRAHLHLEICLMLSARYDDWHIATGKGYNRHGIHNGMNLIGVDPTEWFLARQRDPLLRFSEFVTNTPVYFKVAVPAGAAPPELLARYPWLLTPTAAAAGPDTTQPPAWEISFSATGVPTRVVPCQRQVKAPMITQVRAGELPHRFLTRNLVTGEGASVTLTGGGGQLLTLICGDFPGRPEAAAAVPKPAVEKPRG